MSAAENETWRSRIGGDSAEEQADGDGAVRRVLWVTLLLNMAVAILKGVAGSLTGSVGLMADALHSVFDSLSNVVGLGALRFASEPPDEDHPYGHHKIEVAAALVIGLLILIGTWELGQHVALGLIEGIDVDIRPWAAAVVVVSIGVSLGVSLWERRVGERENSLILSADASHTASDALASLAVLAGMGMTALGFPAGDVIAGGVVMIMVGKTGYAIIRRALDVLVDMSRLEPEEVRSICREVPGLLSCHNVRSRGMQGHIHLDLHVTFSPELTLAEAGERVLMLRRLLREEFEDVRDIVIQLEPHLPGHLPPFEEGSVDAQPPRWGSRSAASRVLRAG